MLLPERLLARVTDLRVCDPELAFRLAAKRPRRERLAPDGRLNILAADHPARRVTKAAGDILAMADRRDYLSRVVRVLSSELVDGVMATMDILEDLLVIDSRRREEGAAPLLDRKVIIASLNRGGLAQACWEMDDPVTGPSPATCVEWGFDGAKILLRICDGDPGSVKTLVAAAQAITESSCLKLPMFLEPLPVARTEHGYSVLKERSALARTVGVASALGETSRYTWLKLPYCEGYETVARATTLPILLLGGESAGDPTPFLREVKAGLAAGPNVRGVLVGRNVLYPGDRDPREVADALRGFPPQAR